MLSQAPRKRSNQAKLMLGTSVGIKTLAQARFHTASTQSCHFQPSKQTLENVIWSYKLDAGI
jgi:hypothetical protein